MSVFQIQRIRRQENPEATRDLIDTSVQMLSAIVGMTKHFQHGDVKRNFGWIVSLSVHLSIDFHTHLIHPKNMKSKKLTFEMSVVWSLWQCSRWRSRHRSTPLYNLQSASSIINTSLRDYSYAELPHLVVSICQNAF